MGWDSVSNMKTNSKIGQFIFFSLLTTKYRASNLIGKIYSSKHCNQFSCFCDLCRFRSEFTFPSWLMLLLLPHEMLDYRYTTQSPLVLFNYPQEYACLVCRQITWHYFLKDFTPSFLHLPQYQLCPQVF